MKNNRSNIEPDDSMFKYDRRNIPIYFAQPQDEEVQIWLKSTNSITRYMFNYVTSTCRGLPDSVKEDMLLKNGMTVGEYCMFHIQHVHERRVGNIKPSQNMRF